MCEIEACGNSKYLGEIFDEISKDHTGIRLTIVQ